MADRAGERVQSECDQNALGNARALFHEAKPGTKPLGAKMTKPRRSLWSRHGRGFERSCRSPFHRREESRRRPSPSTETSKAYLCSYAVTFTIL